MAVRAILVSVKKFEMLVSLAFSLYRLSGDSSNGHHGFGIAN